MNEQEKRSTSETQPKAEAERRDAAGIRTAPGNAPASTETMARAMQEERSGGTAAIADAGARARDGGSARNGADPRETPLFGAGESETFRQRWTEVQTGFVDEPRRAVEQADGLVAEVIQRLAQVFAEERSALERQWDRGDDVDTEQLRVALQRYRSFFERLLAA